jgi:hypothetical protein
MGKNKRCLAKEEATTKPETGTICEEGPKEEAATGVWDAVYAFLALSSATRMSFALSIYEHSFLYP